jgi:ABC-type antimicrobial peptide transport system ATPase subunit
MPIVLLTVERVLKEQTLRARKPTATFRNGTHCQASKLYKRNKWSGRDSRAKRTSVPIYRRTIGSRIAVMYLGRIAEEEETEALFRSPGHPYTVALLRSVLTPEPGLGIPDIQDLSDRHS